MLDRAIAERSVQEADLAAAIGLLAAFYGAAPAEPINPAAYRRGLEHAVRLHREVLLEPQYEMPGAEVQAVVRAQLALLRSAPQLFDDRVAAGRIVEGHGDLRPGHVYLGPPPAVIDCLEFNRDLRIVDPIDEIGFLAMECRFRDADAVARQVLDVYVAQSGDTPPAALLAFHQSRRACLRARLCLRHIAGPDVTDAAKWRARAMAYLNVAQDYAAVFES
jgi:aminoglycoside phosphotransferase family enzyme